MANEVRLIDAVKYREMLEEEIAFSEENGKEERVHGLEIAVADLMDAPTIDPESLRPKGRWVMKETMIRSPFAKNAYCSECLEETAMNYNYCPNCGADMREGKDENHT